MRPHSYTNTTVTPMGDILKWNQSPKRGTFNKINCHPKGDVEIPSNRTDLPGYPTGSATNFQFKGSVCTAVAPSASVTLMHNCRSLPREMGTD